jgi:hypothetical protein
MEVYAMTSRTRTVAACVAALALTVLTVTSAALARPAFEDEPPPRDEDRAPAPDEDVMPPAGPRFPDEAGVGRWPDLVEGPEHPYQPDLPPLDEGRPGSDRDFRRFFERLPTEERRRVMDFLQEHFPEPAGELELLQAANPRRAYRQLDRLMPDMVRLMQAYEEDSPEVFALRIDEFKNQLEIRKVLRFYHAARDDRERDEQRARLRELLARGFELRQRRDLMEIEQLEQRIAEARHRVERRERARERIIDQALEQRLAPHDERPRRDEGRRGPKSDRPSRSQDRRPRPRPEPGPEPTPEPPEEDLDL